MKKRLHGLRIVPHDNFNVCWVVGVKTFDGGDSFAAVKGALGVE